MADNLAYDGLYQYGYDAWNRMIQVTKAYRDSGGTLHSGSVITLSRYDGLNRRIEKKVQNSADLDCTYGYYYDRQSLIEARNGSSQTIQQYVWGLDYIDELIGVDNNSDPTADNTCDSLAWACIDANYNVSRLIGVIGLDENSQPVYGTVERYEYTPYGQRTVFFSAGSNDPDAYAPTLISRRVTDGTTVQPYGICPVGHQGLYLDEESGIIRDRARDYKPDWGRFMQPDPRRYVDGMNYYQYEASNPVTKVDPTGTVAWDGQNDDDPIDGKVGVSYDIPAEFKHSKFEGQPCNVPPATVLGIWRSDGAPPDDSGTINMGVSWKIMNAYEPKIVWWTCIRINKSTQVVPGCIDQRTCPLRVRANIFNDNSGPHITQTIIRFLSCDKCRWKLHFWKVGGTYTWQAPWFGTNHWQWSPSPAFEYSPQWQ